MNDHTAGFSQRNFDDKIGVEVCRKSGFRSSKWCDDTEMLVLTKKSLNAPLCPYHVQTFLNDKGHQVSANCWPISQIKPYGWFILPPVQAYYFKRNNPTYKPLPPYEVGCEQNSPREIMEFIYPKDLSEVYIPIGLDGQANDIVFHLAHSQKGARVYWHVDNDYMGSTSHEHQIAVRLKKGKHRIVVADHSGNRLEKVVNVLSE